MKFKRCCGR
ncbi:MAG: hypothetical protein KC456_13590 [Flavobacteriales bacterium]|nr:hypothetical protein [Flavobacteriales bacterium]